MNFCVKIYKTLNRSFKNILLPVDFSTNTDLAINKLIDLMVSKDVAIHLLHHIKTKKKSSSGYPDQEFKMLQLKTHIENSLPGATVATYISYGNDVEEIIIQKAKEIKPELIIIGKHSNKSFFSFKKTISSGKLAKKTGCGILTVKPGSLDHKIKSIVIPIGKFIPTRKLELLITLAWKKNTTVYLVPMLDQLKDFDGYDSSVSHTLVETYKLLKGEVNCQISHKLISGNNVAKTALRFAESVNADLLLVNPEEINISNFAGLDTSDLINCNSKLQLLTVAPEAQQIKTIRVLL